MCMSLQRIELILEKKYFFNFLGVDLLTLKRDHRHEKQLVLGVAPFLTVFPGTRH